MLANDKNFAIGDDELDNVNGGVNTKIQGKTRVQTCPTCNGKCVINGAKCTKCKGNGVIEL